MNNISSYKSWGPRKYWYIGSLKILACFVILRTSFSYFSHVALSVGLFHPLSNKLAASDATVYYLAFGIQTRFVLLASDSADYFLVISSSTLIFYSLQQRCPTPYPLTPMLPNFVECCTYIFRKSCGWATVSEKHVDRKAVVKVRSTRAACPAWDGQKAGWDGYLAACFYGKGKMS